MTPTHMHRNALPPRYGSRLHTTQRLVMLELLIDPPAGGDHPHDLARRLNLPTGRVGDALVVLAGVGLVRDAETDGKVRASHPARYLDALIPVAL